jgi:glycosyltransferase involved in cell wall biosynthesis
VKSLGLGARVQFAGRVSDKKLLELYRHADLFLFPSEYEGYGIALAEALAQGVPYIAFNRGAVKELVGMGMGIRRGTRQQGGYLLEGDDIGDMVQVLRRLIGDPDEREVLSCEAYKLSDALPRWEETGCCFRRAVEKTAGREMR